MPAVICASQLALFDAAPAPRAVPAELPAALAPAPPTKPWLTKSDLLRRGWTEPAIARFLGEPGRRRRNPFGVGPDVCLYGVARVVSAEASAEFAAWKRAKDVRSSRAHAAIDRKAETLLARIKRFALRQEPLEALRAKAIEHYNGRRLDRMLRQAEGGWGDEVFSPPASVESDPHFLARITTNYVRHVLLPYDETLDALYAMGRRERADDLRRQVYGAIGAAYPELAEEAARQLERRTGGPR